MLAAYIGLNVGGLNVGGLNVGAPARLDDTRAYLSRAYLSMVNDLQSAPESGHGAPPALLRHLPPSLRFVFPHNRTGRWKRRL